MKKIIRDKLILIIILLLFQGFNSYGPYRNNGYNDPHNPNSNRYIYCYESCKSCNKYIEYDFMKDEYIHNCIECADNYYKLGESNCYSTIIKNFGYYLYEKNGNMVWGKCYKRCETCEFRGNDLEMNCTTCNYYYIGNSRRNKYRYRLNGKNCDRCGEGQYINKNNKCVNKCEDSYGFSFNHSCLKNCPANYEKDEVQKKCVLQSFNQTMPLDELRSQITENITRFLNYSSPINGTDYVAIILSNDKEEPEKQLEKGISAVGLGGCSPDIKDYYNISRNESLIILNMETKINNIKTMDIEESEEEKESEDNSNNLGKISQVEVFDISGRNLNLSVCNKKITIMKFINDTLDEEKIEFAENMAKQGINVFNLSDDFFNDLCRKFDITDGKDIILKDRVNDYYIDEKFCQKGCTHSGMDYKLKVAICVCDASSVQGENIIENNKEEQSENLSFESIAKSFASSLLDFNFDVIFCYNLVFDFQRLSKNIGFYIMLIMFILQIIFLIIYSIKKLKPIKDYMLKYNKLQNIRVQTFLSIKNNKNDNSKKNFQIKKEKSNFAHQHNSNLNNINKNNGQNNKGKVIFINNFAPTINIQSNAINNNNNDNKNISSMNKIINLTWKNKKNKRKTKRNNNKLNKMKSENNSKTSMKNKSINYLVTKSENKSKKNQISTVKKEISDVEDLLDMEYIQAINKDRSSFLIMFWAFLVDSQIILTTFFTKNYLQLFVIKLSFLVCTFDISFFLNALFYTDDYISDAYHNNGVLDFFSGLPKSIYSFILTLISTNLLRMLSNSKSELMRTITKFSMKSNYLVLIELKLKKLRKKLIIYFILVILLEICFLYYVSAFCAVYIHSQKYWIIGFLESFAIDSLVAVVLCIILASLRYLAIKKRKKFLYILSNIISKIL